MTATNRTYKNPLKKLSIIEDTTILAAHFTMIFFNAATTKMDAQETRETYSSLLSSEEPTTITTHQGLLSKSMEDQKMSVWLDLRTIDGKEAMALTLPSK